jgi:plastocyanin
MHRLLPLFLAISLPLAASTIEVRVQNARGVAMREAVVYAIPEGRPIPPVRNRTAVMDQRNRMFLPHVLVVQTGTAVRFPNSDDIRHHVYSFSPAKPFQLPLYKGTPANPEVFDRAGVVTLGCNIHDQMSAFIVIVDTPYFEKTGANGKTTLKDLEAGRYSVHVWYPDLRTAPAPVNVTVKSGETASVSFK